MSGRNMSFAFVALFLLPLTGAPETFHYKITQNFQQTIDLSGVGQGEQKVNGETHIFITLHTRDSAGGSAIHAMVDSVVMGEGSNPQIAASINTLKGLSGNGFLDSERKLHGFDADSSAPGASMKGLVVSVVPAMKPGTKAGASWTDTTSSTDPSPNGGTTSRTSWTAFTTAAGENGSLRVTSNGNYEIAGIMPGGMALEGTGKHHGVYSILPSGFVITGEFADTAQMSITTDQAPAPIPIENITASRIQLLK